MKKTQLAKFILLVVLSLGGLSAFAQTQYEFTYDDSGNRIRREIIVLQAKSASLLSENLLNEEDEITSLFGEGEVVIYPNPTKGILRIDLPSLTANGVTLRLFDNQGRMLQSKQAVEMGNELELSHYSSGLYILVIQSGDQKKEWKIVKE